MEMWHILSNHVIIIEIPKMKIKRGFIMSEQTIQNDLYSQPVTILDKYTCLSLGATSINELIRTGKLRNAKVQKNF